MSREFRGGARSILAINTTLMMAAGCAAIAWTIWPQSTEWWGLGVLSVLLGLGAVIGFGKALGEMAALHRKNRALYEYEARGGEPKPTRMASVSDLKRAGMLDE